MIVRALSSSADGELVILKPAAKDLSFHPRFFAALRMTFMLRSE
jgi:hypothetical protein